jgi:hypothetical protein
VRQGPLRFHARLLIALPTSYVLALVTEAALGGTDPLAVGWRNPWVPLIAEGAAMGAIIRGWIGVALAPLPFFLTPETLRWLRTTAVDLLAGDRFFGLAALVYVTPLVFATWFGGILGSLIGWLVCISARRCL